MADDKDHDFELPDLPSDEELGIRPEDYELLDEDGELRRDAPSPGKGASKAEPATPPAEPSARARRKAEKASRKEAKRAARAARKRARRTARASGESDGVPAALGPPGAGGGEGTGAPDAEAGGKRPKRPPQPPGGRYRGPVALAVLLVGAFLSGPDRHVPGPVPANAPPETFSSARAMTDLVEVARTPHAPGSPEHDRVREYVLGRLENLGLEPSVQTATAIIRRGESARAATVRNLVGRMGGEESTGAVLVTAHYDAREQSPGAGDDGTGVVAILEAIRAVRASGPMRNDLIVLITDAEEEGLLGARAFVEGHPWMDDVSVVLSVEMRGGGGPSIMFETGRQGGWAIDVYARTASHAFANSMSFEIYRRMPNDTDFTPFKQAGKQGLNFAAIGRANVYHQRYDSPQNLSEATLQHHGVNLVEMLRAFGAADLAVVDGPDPVYFTLPGAGLVVYGERWVLPFTMVMALLWVGALLLGRRKGLGWGGVVAGLVFALAVAGLAAGVGWLAFRELRDLHPEFGSLLGSAFHSEGWYVLALAAAVVTVAVVLLSILRRWFTAAELTLGAAVLPLAAVVGLSVLAPLAAANLQWPTLAMILAGTGLALLGRERETGTAGTVLVLVLALPVLVFLVQMTELVWLAMTFALAAGLGGLIALTCVLLLPALDALRRPNAWWAPLVGIASTGAFLGIGVLNAEPSADRPAPSTLVFAQDRETGAATWATDPVRPADHPGVAWAVDRVGEFGPVDTLSAFFVRGGTYRTRQADALALTGPETRLVADGPVDGRRLVRLGLRSTVAAELMTVRVPDGVDLVAVNGLPLPGRDVEGNVAEERIRTLEHWGRPEGMVYLDLAVAPAAAELALPVVEHLLRPQELLGEDTFLRPPDLAPDVRRGSDRVMIRSVVRTELGGAGLTAPAPFDPSGGDAAGGSPTPPPADSSGVEAAGPIGTATTDTATSTGPIDAPATGQVPRDSVPADSLAADTTGGPGTGGPAGPVPGTEGAGAAGPASTQGGGASSGQGR